MFHLRGFKVSITTDQLRERTLAEFEETLNDIEDQTAYILQAHLYLEQQLGRIIAALLPGGEELLLATQWTFHHKALLVRSFDVLPEGIYETLKGFNSLRNRMAHRLRYEVTSKDIAELAALLPESHVQDRVSHRYPLTALQSIAISLLGSVGTLAVAVEHLKEEARDDA